MRREINLGSLLVGLRKENPTKSISLVRLIWPDIKAALLRGHTLKEIHARLVKGGLKIDYKKLSVYVSRLRRDEAREQPETQTKPQRSETSPVSPAPGAYGNIHRVGNTIINLVPNRRLFSASAAAQYLGMNGQTLRRITDLGLIRARNIAGRRVYVLEDLDHYIESLPKVIVPLAS